MALPQLDRDPRKGRGHQMSAPIEWVASLGCWCVFDAKTIATILKSTDFSAADFVELHQTLERRVGIDCSAMIQVLRHTPIANEGECHAKLRRDLARVLTADAAVTKEHTIGVVHEVVTKTCRPGASTDLAQDVVRPVCDALFESLLGVTTPGRAEGGVSASQTFDLYLGLNRRKQTNAKVGTMLRGFSAAEEKLKTTPEYAVSLSMLGYDSIVGSLGCSLLHVLREGAGKRLCDLSFPRVLPATGVPYIERFAADDCMLSGASFRKGDRVRLYLDAGSVAGEERPYFGKGRHSCLGEELSTWLWRTLTAELGRLPLAWTIESVARRQPDWVFVYYSSIVVRFHA
jgi:cytochrome P450